MESQIQIPEFTYNPENFHPCSVLTCLCSCGGWFEPNLVRSLSQVFSRQGSKIIELKNYSKMFSKQSVSLTSAFVLLLKPTALR